MSSSFNVFNIRSRYCFPSNCRCETKVRYGTDGYPVGHVYSHMKPYLSFIITALIVFHSKAGTFLFIFAITFNIEIDTHVIVLWGTTRKGWGMGQLRKLTICVFKLHQKIFKVSYSQKFMFFKFRKWYLTKRSKNYERSTKISIKKLRGTRFVQFPDFCPYIYILS